jgi:hypothetical protein
LAAFCCIFLVFLRSCSFFFRFSSFFLFFLSLLICKTSRD